MNISILPTKLFQNLSLFQMTRNSNFDQILKAAQRQTPSYHFETYFDWNSINICSFQKPIIYLSYNQKIKMDIQGQKKFSYLDQYKIIKTLGAGYHAQVKLGQDQQGKYFAIKKYKKETANLAVLQHELNIMKNLDHENLVRLIDVRENATYKKQNQTTYKCFAIILQYVGGGELFDFIADTGKFSEIVARTYFHQMMNGLYYMHSKGYAHRDIKPQNILLSHQFVLKLADFGFSCLLKGKDGTGILHTKLGTEGYMAPQIPSKNYQGAKCDIFASGVILFIMYAGNPPFEKAVPNDPYYKLLKDKKYDTFWKAHSRRRPINYFSEQFKDLFVKMVAYNPSQRPKIQQIAAHPWVKGSVCTHSQIKEEFSLRQNKLDVILEQRRKQQEIQKQQNMTAATSGASLSRGSEDDTENQIVQNLRTELHLKRNLPNFSVILKDDIILDEGVPYAVALIKDTLRNFKIQIEEDTESVDIDESNLMKVVKVSDNQAEKISVDFQYDYGTEDDESKQTVGMSINLGRSEGGKLVLHFERESGNLLYYKKIINELKGKFAYAIKN